MLVLVACGLAVNAAPVACLLLKAFDKLSIFCFELFSSKLSTLNPWLAKKKNLQFKDFFNDYSKKKQNSYCVEIFDAVVSRYSCRSYSIVSGRSGWLLKKGG